MKNFTIIDAHTHVYPDNIAEKASQAISDFYGVRVYAAGRADKLLAEGAEVNVSKYVICSCATAMHQVRHINDFIIKETQCCDKFVGLMTLHPDMEDTEIRDEIDRCIACGLKGIKLHPDFQRFYLDEDKAKKIYDAASGRLPILFHTGDKRYEYSSPYRLAKVAREYPELTVVGAHFGGYSEWEKISCYKGLKNVYLDTSSSLAFIGKAEAKRFIDYFGAEWFLFGSDFPMWNIPDEVKMLASIDISDEDKTAIFAGNAMRVFNLQ